MEMSYLSEVEIYRKIFILVLDGKIVVFSFISWALTELNVLTVDLNFWIAGSSHHLNFQIIMTLSKVD